MKRSFFLMVTILTLALAACGGSTPATKAITLDAKDIAFGATTIEVTAGQPVRLTLNNTGALDHDFSILEIPLASKPEQDEAMAGHNMDMTVEPELHVAVAPGKSATLEFTPTKPGTYEFFCTTAGHKEAGMVGALVVKEP